MRILNICFDRSVSVRFSCRRHLLSLFVVFLFFFAVIYQSPELLLGSTLVTPLTFIHYHLTSPPPPSRCRCLWRFFFFYFDLLSWLCSAPYTSIFPTSRLPHNHTSYAISVLLFSVLFCNHNLSHLRKRKILRVTDVCGLFIVV